MATKQEILFPLPFDFLLSFAFEAKLLRSAWVNSTKKDVVHMLIRALSEEYCEMLKSEYSQTGRYNRTLETVLFMRPTADDLRDKFIVNVLRRLNDYDAMIAKELRLNGTRVDIACFNGFSWAYEVKSARDKFTRLWRQVSLYSQVFEYVNIVCDGEFEEKCPEHVGIYELRRSGHALEFYERRKARLNDAIEPIQQLRLLRLRELRELVEEALDVRDTLSRSAMIDLVSSAYSRAQVNEIYKKTIMKRLSHSPRQEHSRRCPTDLASFFETSEPYSRRSDSSF